MISLEDQKLFEQYYQAAYDFNTSSLNGNEIDTIKELVKEKRVHYALAPIGAKIFDFIMEQCPRIDFELIEFENQKIDGMLYIPKSGDEKAYIILNSSKPLINQIFAASHEYYHYIKDYESIKQKPYVCYLSSLNSLNEKMASRFAAELLLPEDALRKEIKSFRKAINCSNQKVLNFEEFAIISMYLTVKYQLPLKATIFRLHEEGYISDIKLYIQNYDVIKRVLLQIEIFKKNIDQLYNSYNQFLENKVMIYQQIEKAYKNGLVSREEIIRDSEILQLDINIITSFFNPIDDSDENEDDYQILSYFKKSGEV